MWHTPFSPVQINNFSSFSLLVSSSLHDSLFLIVKECQKKLIFDFYGLSCCSLTFTSLPQSFGGILPSNLNNFVVLWCSLFVQYGKPLRKAFKGKRKLVNISQRSKGVSIEIKLLWSEQDPSTIMRKNSKKLFSHIREMWSHITMRLTRRLRAIWISLKN